jgi:PAS domain S-box-containing protein
MASRESIAAEMPDWVAQMASVLEALNEGVIIAREGQSILFANSSFLQMTGFSRDELAKFGALDFFSPEERNFLKQQIEVSIRAGHHRYAFVLPQKGGGRLPVIVSSRAIQNAAGDFGIVTFTDISDQVRAEEALRASNASLQHRQSEIEEDLRLAARVQKSLAPRSHVWNDLSVDVFYHPVHSIGGDFALVNTLDDEDVSVLVCDVSGHGIGSALVANRIYSETTTHVRSGMPLVEMFGELNRFLMEDIGSGMYITAEALRIRAGRRSMIYAGAGHPPAMIARCGEAPILLESQSTILGTLPDAVDISGSMEVELRPDDRIVLYTDGISEVFNAQGQMLGTHGVQELVRKASDLPAEKMKQAILEGVNAWREGPPTDDVSLMLVHVR